MRHDEEWQYARTGTDLLLLSENYARWIPRRDERIEFVGRDLIRRTVKVDIDLTAFVVGGSNSASIDALDLDLFQGRLVVPVTALKAGQHTTFDVRNEDGATLTRLTTNEERFLVYAGFGHIARERLGEDLHQSTKDFFYRSIKYIPDAGRTPQADTILEDSRVRAVFEGIRSSRLLAVLLNPDRGMRRVITYTWLEALQPHDQLDGILLSAAQSDDPNEGKRRRGRLELMIDVSTAGDAKSYHLEISAPNPLQVAYARLYLADPETNDISTATDDDRLTEHAHVHVADKVRRTRGHLLAGLQLLPHGLIRLAFVGTLLNLLTISFVAMVRWLGPHVGFFDAHVDPGSGVELFLLVPAIAGPLFASTPSAGLADSLQLPFRTMLWGGSVGAFLAAGAVATGARGALEVLLWFMAVVLAMATTIDAFVSRRQLASTAPSQGS